MNSIPTTYIIGGGLAVSGIVVYNMYLKDTRFYFNGQPGFTFSKWLFWQIAPVHKNALPGPKDYDNISKEDRAIIDRQFSVPTGAGASLEQARGQ